MTIEEIAELIKIRRKELRLSQSDLADIAEVSARFVFDLEKAKPSVSFEKLLAVLTALGLEINIGIIR